MNTGWLGKLKFQVKAEGYLLQHKNVGEHKMSKCVYSIAYFFRLLLVMPGFTVTLTRGQHQDDI